MTPNKPDPDVNLPKLTNVAGLSTMTSAFFSPMKAMYRPIPALIAVFKAGGMTSTIFSRRLVTVSRMKARPSRNTAVRANCQE